jgi:hypothetical protein
MITEFRLPYHGTYVREIKYSVQIMCLPENSNDLIVALLRRCYPEITEEAINELAYKNKAFTIFGTIQIFNGGPMYAVLYRHDGKWFIYYVPQSIRNSKSFTDHDIPKNIPCFMGF